MTAEKRRRKAIENWKRDRAAIERYKDEAGFEHSYRREPASTGMKWAIIAALVATLAVPIVAYLEGRTISMNEAAQGASTPSTCQLANDLRESRGLKRVSCP